MALQWASPRFGCFCINKSTRRLATYNFSSEVLTLNHRPSRWKTFWPIFMTFQSRFLNRTVHADIYSKSDSFALYGCFGRNIMVSLQEVLQAALEESQLAAAAVCASKKPKFSVNNRLTWKWQPCKSGETVFAWIAVKY